MKQQLHSFGVFAYGCRNISCSLQTLTKQRCLQLRIRRSFRPSKMPAGLEFCRHAGLWVEGLNGGGVFSSKGWMESNLYLPFLAL